ncbi:MAG: hypothetical protein RIR26_1523 [Pseudomonadota bacterium]
MNVQEFLQKCSESSNSAYENLKTLSEMCQTEESRSETRRFLTALMKTCEESYTDADECLSKFHFTFSRLVLNSEGGEEKTLKLIQLPSIFTPEEWSFTFYEGLARYPNGEFQGKMICELGCGNGWISIALAARTLPHQLIGLDINPRAITCAKLNLLLNALDDSGAPLVDAEGKTLLERVEFHTSDLLSYPIKNGISLDRIIGCIPQVLSPEPMTATHFVSEEADDSFLYSLSNYCDKQGYIEDQFGLGLIARALEESIEISKPSAKVILNLGGRPGTAVLERLFLRRGFSIKKLWSTKVWQAQDTDIGPLVEIEKLTPHRFEFFTSLTSDDPICAHTANEYVKNGGKIAHSLSVYEANITYPSPIKSLFKLIRQPEFKDTRSGIDLSFANEELAEEKINFIGNLSDWLQQKPNLPYADTEGETILRRQIAQFFRSYWKIPWTAKSIFVAPDRKSVISNFIHLLSPKLTLVEKDLLNLLPKRMTQKHNANEKSTLSVVEAPKRVDEICKLIEALSPQLVITSLQDFECKTSDAFLRLNEICRRKNAKLILDLSHQFELSSHPAQHGVLSYLSDQRLPDHIVLLFGLVNNKVYKDLELCFLVSENGKVLKNLSASAELTYSRTPILSQRYYARIFADLLNFQLTDLRKSKNDVLRVPQYSDVSEEFPLNDFVSRAFQHPAVTSNELPMTSSTVRLDYGENCLQSPPHVHAAIMESFVRQNISSQEVNCERPLLDLINTRFGLSLPSERNVILGNGVAPLFAAFLEFVGEKGESILLPRGIYGYFKAACDYFNVNHGIIPTKEKNRFKITVAELDEELTRSGAKWLYLNAPVVNPTGAIYSNGELLDLLGVLKKHNCGMVLDTIFSGLEFQDSFSNINLNLYQSLGAQSLKQIPMVVLGGVSKELAAGGLRFGWAVSQDEELLQNIRLRLSTTPHSTVRYAARKIFSALNDRLHPIHGHLNQQRAILRERSRRLCSRLESLGWDVLEPEGGLFLCASPTRHLGFNSPVAKIKEEQESLQVYADKTVLELFQKTGLLVNSATWTGLPAHLRFVLSVEHDVFEMALRKLQEFDSVKQIGQH